MLRFFFNRKSKFVRLLELIGVSGFIAVFVSGAYFSGTGFFKWMFVVLLFEYIFVRFCSVWKWYKKFPKTTNETGIGLQFRKALVPTAYIMVIANAGALLNASGGVLLFFVIVMALVIHVNIILIYLHLMDRDTRAPNCFSQRP